MLISIWDWGGNMFWNSLINEIYVVANKYNNAFANWIISVPPSFDSPYTLSTKEIGTSPTLNFICLALMIISIWKTNPFETHDFTSFSRTDFLYNLKDSMYSYVVFKQFMGMHEAYRKLPVKSLTPGLSSSWVRKLAPLLTNFLLKSQPDTPPSPM